MTIRDAGTSTPPSLLIADATAVEGDVAALSGDVIYLTVALTAQVASPVVINWTTYVDARTAGAARRPYPLSGGAAAGR